MRKKKRAVPGNKKRKVLDLVFILIIFIAGAAILAYPAASNLVNQFQQDKVVRGYREVVGGQSKEELEAMRAQAQKYNEDLMKDEIIVDPFNQVRDRKAGIEYYETLNPQHDGMMATIRIPSIKVELPIYHGTEEEVLQKAIGHLEQTSFPVGGKGTHAVISGHRGLPSAKLFTDLNLLEMGDVFYIDVLDETLAYEVDKITTVEPNHLEDLAIVSEEDYVTLVTCTPYAINSHRLLVRGTRIPYEEEIEASGEREQESKEKSVAWPYIITALVVVLVLFIFGIIRKCKRIRRCKKR